MEFTNVKIIPSATAITKIKRFCDVHGLPHADFDAAPHCTIVFSRDIIVPARKIPRPDFERIAVRNPRLKIFHTRDDGDCLVMCFSSDKLARANAFYRGRLNIPAKYEYVPHITLQKNLARSPRLPRVDFDFMLDKVVIENK